MSDQEHNRHILPDFQDFLLSVVRVVYVVKLPLITSMSSSPSHVILSLCVTWLSNYQLSNHHLAGKL